MKKSGNYVDSKRFAELLLLAQAEGKVCAELCLYAGEMGKRIHSKWRFAGITAEDAYSVGVHEVVTKFAKYKHEEGKNSRSFAYFTTLILNSLRGVYRKEQAYENLKVKVKADLWASKKRSP
jgi:hypothetical protein